MFASHSFDVWESWSLEGPLEECRLVNCRNTQVFLLLCDFLSNCMLFLACLLSGYLDWRSRRLKLVGTNGQRSCCRIHIIVLSHVHVSIVWHSEEFSNWNIMKKPAIVTFLTVDAILHSSFY